MRYNLNTTKANLSSLIMYVDMNSYFASCEQWLNRTRYKGKPIAVCPFEGERAVIIAPSKEAKTFGVKTGMRFKEAQLLCPQLIMVPAQPVEYRKIHIHIMNILRSYCQDVIPKSIDEAAINLSNYRLVYKDPNALALKIKYQLEKTIGEELTCSIGIAPNCFLAKLATELRKPDGLVTITPENIDYHLSTLQLTDLPGIGFRSALRLKMLNIHSPLGLRYASESLLRKAFGGIVGSYWYQRLHFGEVDLHTSTYKSMSAARTISKAIRDSKQAQLALLISLCTKLEQRMVKRSVFCKTLLFNASYYDGSVWKTHIKLNEPLQDGIEMKTRILEKIKEAWHQNGLEILSLHIKSMGVVVGDFISDIALQYSLFDNKMQRDIIRKAMYEMKDKYGKNIVRKASETIQKGTMSDAIGFGSVKDLYQQGDVEEDIWGEGFNKYLLERDD